MLDPEQLEILRGLSPGNLHLAGGPVRDMLLGREGNDTDITVAGDACELAQRFVQATGGECTLHERFGTATVRVGQESVDLITARSETYPAPGALPKVKPGTLEDDLARRDFSINAMAVSLEDGALEDPHHGLQDLRDRRIRILHPHSFQQDPTRMLRAVRYEQRLGFRMEELTEYQLRRAITNRALDRVSGDRIRHELEKTSQEEKPLPVFRRMSNLGIFEAIQPGWKPDLGPVPEDWNPKPRGWTAAITRHCGPEALEELIRRLNMPRDQAETARQGTSLELGIQRLRDETDPEAVCMALDPVSNILEPLQATKLYPHAANAVTEYLQRWRHVRPELNGTNLMEMGMPQGPEIGRMLHQLRMLRMDQASTREDEEKLVRSKCGKQPPPTTTGCPRESTPIS